MHQPNVVCSPLECDVTLGRIMQLELVLQEPDDLVHTNFLQLCRKAVAQCACMLDFLETAARWIQVQNTV